MEPYLRLEDQLSESEGGHAVVVNSGTAALHLALECLQLPKGSEVLVPEFTMIACARAVTLAGLVPVFVDCLDNLLIDLVDARKKTTSKTVAVMPVHIYGRRVDDNYMINYLAREADLNIIEDRAEAHGIKYTSRPEAACYSFYRNKIVSGEEGGAIIFRDEKQANLARSLRSLGASEANDFLHIPRGMNYRMSNKQAQVISYSLNELRGNLVKRRKVEAAYDQVLPEEWRMPRRDVPWVYDLRIPGMTGEKQDHLVKTLRLHDIDARHAFKPMSEQPEYRTEGYEKLNAYRLSREVIYLPITTAMNEYDVRRNITELKRLVNE